MTNILRAVSVLGLMVALGFSGCASTTSMKARGLASDPEPSEDFSTILMAGGGIAVAGAAAASCGMAYRTLTAEAEDIKQANIYKELDDMIAAKLKDGGNLGADSEFAQLLAARRELADAVRRGDLTLKDLKQLATRIERQCFVR
jgi:hypothetical protein